MRRPGVDGHGVDGARHDAAVPGPRQHVLQHLAELLRVLDADVGLDDALLLLVVLLPGALPLLLGEVQTIFKTNIQFLFGI